MFLLWSTPKGIGWRKTCRSSVVEELRSREHSFLLAELRLFDNLIYGDANRFLLDSNKVVLVQTKYLFNEVRRIDHCTSSSFYDIVTGMLWRFRQKLFELGVATRYYSKNRYPFLQSAGSYGVLICPVYKEALIINPGCRSEFHATFQEISILLPKKLVIFTFHCFKDDTDLLIIQKPLISTFLAHENSILGIGKACWSVDCTTIASTVMICITCARVNVNMKEKFFCVVAWEDKFFMVTDVVASTVFSSPI